MEELFGTRMRALTEGSNVRSICSVVRRVNRPDPLSIFDALKLACPNGLSPPLRVTTIGNRVFQWPRRSSNWRESEIAFPKAMKGKPSLSDAQRVSAMKSVSRPVSSLMPWSDMINEDPGVNSSESRSIVSCGISIRLRAALA